MFRLSQLSLANRALIALITVFAAVFGVITMGSLKQELIPSIEFPQISVLSTMPGASAEVVDKQVGEPLEQALGGVESVESTTSTSRSGVSTVSLKFAYGTIPVRLVDQPTLDGLFGSRGGSHDGKINGLTTKRWTKDPSAKRSSAAGSISGGPTTNCADTIGATRETVSVR